MGVGMKWLFFLSCLWGSLCFAIPSQLPTDSHSLTVDVLSFEHEIVETWNWTGALKCTQKGHTIQVEFSDPLARYPYKLSAVIPTLKDLRRTKIQATLTDAAGIQWTMDERDLQKPWIGSECKVERLEKTLVLTCEKLRESDRSFAGQMSFQTQLDCPLVKKL